MSTESTTAPDDPTGADNAPNDQTDPTLVPVAEAIRYRKRAQAAEQQLHETQQRLQTLQSQLAEAQASASRLERRQRIDALLIDAGAIDLDAARTLAEHALGQSSGGDGGDNAPDPAAVIAEMQRRRPYLFRRATHAGNGLMSPRLEDASPLEAAAERAAETGDRRDLLAYLRLRRRA